jgi:hypothetical protein
MLRASVCKSRSIERQGKTVCKEIMVLVDYWPFTFNQGGIISASRCEDENNAVGIV